MGLLSRRIQGGQNVKLQWDLLSFVVSRRVQVALFMILSWCVVSTLHTIPIKYRTVNTIILHLTSLKKIENLMINVSFTVIFLIAELMIQCNFFDIQNVTVYFSSLKSPWSEKCYSNSYCLWMINDVQVILFFIHYTKDIKINNVLNYNTMNGEDCNAQYGRSSVGNPTFQ